MGLVFSGNPPTFSGDITAEVPTATYSGISSDDASTSINPYTGQGPGAGGAGQTSSQINEDRAGGPAPHVYQTLIDARTNAFYIATDGNDSNDGSIDTPFLTLEKAVLTAASGDAIVVGAGTTTIDTDDNWGNLVGGGFLDDYTKDLHFFGTPNSTILDADETTHAERDHHITGMKNTSSSVYGIIFTTDPGGSRTTAFNRAMFADCCATPTTGNYFNCVFTSIGDAAIVYDNNNTTSVQIVNSSFEVTGSWVANTSGDNLQFDITDCVFTGTPIFDEIEPTNTSSGVTLDDDWHSDTLDSTRGVYSGTNAWY